MKKNYIDTSVSANESRDEQLARLELEYAEHNYKRVCIRCEAEPGDLISEQLAEERRVCAVRVFDATLKLRLVKLGRADLAVRYDRGELVPPLYDERGPVELAEALVTQLRAPVGTSRSYAEAAYRANAGLRL